MANSRASVLHRTLRWPAGCAYRVHELGRLAAVVAMLAVMGWAPPASAAQTGGRFYPETGHTLEPQFVPVFDQMGGVDILGYPITDGFKDPESGRLIQYTENARLEWIDDNTDGGSRAILRPLGEMMGGYQPPDPQGKASPGCRSFQETGHSVCFAFLDFFDAHGGLGVFGYPISDFEIENDRIVQYFQRFRLDWHPEVPAPDQVQVAHLGRLNFDQSGYDPNLLRPASGTAGADYRITELQASPSVLYPVLTSGSKQHIYVVVRDQNLFPVPGSAVMLVAHFPDGDKTILMPQTDSQGLSRLALDVGDVSRGTKVNVEIWVFFKSLQTVARDSFLVW